MIAALAALLLVTAAAAAEEAPEDAAALGPWLPGDGQRGDDTRDAAEWGGLGYLAPVRLHLDRGGFVEGAFGGVRNWVDGGEILLVLPGKAFRVELSLIDAVTPLGALQRLDTGDLSPALPLQDGLAARTVLKPTWRSHAGVALSFVIPGLGQWIQESEREMGFMFLGLTSFFVAAGTLSLYAPSRQSETERRVLGGMFYGFAVTTEIGAAIHAFQAGRRPVEVAVEPRPETESSAGGRSGGVP